MKLLIWFMSLKRQKPRDAGWYTDGQPLWTPQQAAQARTDYITKRRNERLNPANGATDELWGDLHPDLRALAITEQQDDHTHQTQTHKDPA
ncbi:hypothetical protein [Kribbella deserti]|uniref:Uncharacterized protein n=1 Tax=Kribbella deserti TaxID=1926257 RepID=A0ABV6QNE5_9ACTN